MRCGPIFCAMSVVSFILVSWISALLGWIVCGISLVAVLRKPRTRPHLPRALVIGTVAAAVLALIAQVSWPWAAGIGGRPPTSACSLFRRSSRWPRRMELPKLTKRDQLGGHDRRRAGYLAAGRPPEHEQPGSALVPSELTPLGDSEGSAKITLPSVVSTDTT